MDAVIGGFLGVCALKSLGAEALDGAGSFHCAVVEFLEPETRGPHWSSSFREAMIVQGVESIGFPLLHAQRRTMVRDGFNSSKQG